MYARGMTVRDIQGFLAETYGTHVSPEFISSVTDTIMEEVSAWQSRPLEPMYPVVFFDALRVKIREDAVVRNKAIYLALGILPGGTREILGLWIENTEGAKFRMKVFNDLKTRGVADILIAVTDGLKGMAEALAAVFPATTLQTCIVHLIRNSLEYASWRDRKALAAAIKPIYTAPSAEAAEAELNAFERSALGQKFPTMAATWRRAWDRVIPFFAFPPARTSRGVHHQRHREHQRAAAQDHQDARSLPQRRCRLQADLAGLAQHHCRLGASSQGLEGGDEPVRDPLRGSLHEGCRVICGTALHTASVVRSSQATPARRRGQVSEAPQTQKSGYFRGGRSRSVDLVGSAQPAGVVQAARRNLARTLRRRSARHARSSIQRFRRGNERSDATGQAGCSRLPNRSQLHCHRLPASWQAHFRSRRSSLQCRILHAL